MARRASLLQAPWKEEIACTLVVHPREVTLLAAAECRAP